MHTFELRDLEQITVLIVFPVESSNFKLNSVEVYPDGAFSVDLHRWKRLIEYLCGFLYSQNYVLDLWERTAGHLTLPAKTLT